MHSVNKSGLGLSAGRHFDVRGLLSQGEFDAPATLHCLKKNESVIKAQLPGLALLPGTILEGAVLKCPPTVGSPGDIYTCHHLRGAADGVESQLPQILKLRLTDFPLTWCREVSQSQEILDCDFKSTDC